MRHLLYWAISRYRAASAFALRFRRGGPLVACLGMAAIAILLSTTERSAAADREVDLQLVLAVDVSRSMDPDEAALVRLGFVHAIRHRDVVDAIERGWLGRIAVTYVEWGGSYHQRTGVDWTEISDAESAVAFARAIEQSSVVLVNWTSISGAIAFSAQRFEGNGFSSQRRIIDIAGDGPNNAGPYVLEARNRALASGIVINGLPIINNRPQANGYPNFPDLDLYYEDCVIGGPGSFMVVANGFNDFARAILRKLVTEIAGRVPPRDPVRLVADRLRPPCNAGEIQLQRYLDYGTY